MDEARRVLPWRDWREWESVCAVVQAVQPGAFEAEQPPPPPPGLALALERLAIWELRGRVPLVVTITRLLLRCVAGEVLGEDLVGVLALAIVRLVNGLVAPWHGATAASLSQVAGHLSLPLPLVELRHAASHHATLPSLAQWRAGAALAWAWLQTHYWGAQHRLVGAEVAPPLAALERLLSLYRRAAKDELRTPEAATFARKKAAAAALRGHFGALQGAPEELRAHVDALLQQLVPQPVYAPSPPFERADPPSERRVRALPRTMRRVWGFLVKRLPPPVRAPLCLALAALLTQHLALRRKSSASLCAAWLEWLVGECPPDEATQRALLPALPPNKWGAKLVRALQAHAAPALLPQLTAFLKLWGPYQALRKTKRSRQEMETGEKEEKDEEEEEEEEEEAAQEGEQAMELDPALPGEHQASTQTPAQTWSSAASWTACAAVPVGLGVLLDEAPHWAPLDRAPPSPAPAPWLRLPIWT